MKVLLVNTYDYGGAAKACQRLHLSLLNAGVTSEVLLRNKQNDWQQTYQFEPLESDPDFQKKLKRKLRRLAQELKLYRREQNVDHKKNFLNSRPKGLELFSYPDSHLDITQSPLYREADIINLHWVANFLDFESFFRKNKKPVVWTLHDTNPFTGGEHYEEEYLGLDDKGYPIKRRRSDMELRVIDQNLKLKKEILSVVNDLTIVSPSRWLFHEAQKSEVFGRFQIKYIPNGLDSTIYKPLDKGYSRKLLDIPQEKRVILFVSDSLKNYRKGFIFLQRALEQIESKNVLLCAVGNNSKELHLTNDILVLGAINDERLMTAAFSAADVFVIPSLMDNLPNTVLESLMCGTPVIGFPVGGIPDMITDGRNGLIAEEISVSALLKALLEFINSTDVFSKEKIRADAVKKYDSKIQAKRYISLFEDILYGRQI